jgi:hypothetical protein
MTQDVAKRKPGRPKAQPSAPAPSSLPAYEVTGLCAEAFEAYDFRDDRVRFDSLGRKWTFRLGQTSDQSELHLIVSKFNTWGSAEERTDKISTALLSTDLGMDFVVESVRALDAAL